MHLYVSRVRCWLRYIRLTEGWTRNFVAVVVIVVVVVVVAT